MVAKNIFGGRSHTDHEACMLVRLFDKLFQNRNQQWTFYAQMARLLSGFAFIGLLARTLPSQLLGTWYIFISIFGIAGLIEMGLGQVIGRHAAYLKADCDLGRITGADFLLFSRIGERFYIVLSCVVSVIAFFSGIWWFKSNTQINLDASLVTAWLVYVSGGGFTIIGMYYTALMNDAGELWQSQRAAILAAGLNILVLFFLLIVPASLLLPATALLVSQSAVVLLLRHAFFNSQLVVSASQDDGIATLDISEEIKKIARDAVKMLVIMVSFQMLSSGFVLVLSSHLSAGLIGSYGLTMQLVGVVMTFSMIWSQSNFFEMAAMRQNSDAQGLRNIFLGGLARAATVASLGMLAIFFAGSLLLSWIGSKTILLQPVILAVVLAVVLFEFLVAQLSQMTISQGDMRVAYFSLLAALLICTAAILMLNAGYSLAEVFAVRLCLYACIVGIPILFISNKLLKIQQLKTDMVKHEIA